MPAAGETVLGLDIGPTSIGWALLRTDPEAQQGEILACGVRVFPEGVDRDTQGHEQSKTQARRQARQMRRQHMRRRVRRRKLRAILTNAGLLPADPVRCREILRTDPYPLRARALDQRLEPFELGRVLYHLNQRRGFRSNRKTGRSQEDGEVYRQTQQLRAEIEQTGSRSLGEYLFRIGYTTDGDGAVATRRLEQRLRGRYTLRSMYEEEFDRIWETQRQFHAALLTDDLRRRLRDETIFYQRPLRSAARFIGRCPLEPRKRRCPRANWYAQQFRMLKEINNLEVWQPGEGYRPLTDEERTRLIDALGRAKELTFDRIRRELGLLEEQVFNLERSPTGRRTTRRPKLTGNTVEATLLKAFGRRWDTLSEDERHEIRRLVVTIEDADRLRQIAAGQWGLNERAIEALLKLELPEGYMAYSLRAIKRLLPHLEQGMKEYDAIQAAGYDSGEHQPVHQRLPLPLRDGRAIVNNPLVRQALFEVRKVVNAIIREHGKPDRIAIEMVREMKQPAWRREEIQRRIRQNERERENIRHRLREEFGVANPTGKDILAIRLWEQQGCICPYTGRTISSDHIRAYLRGEGVLDIDHILPHNRSLDNSQANKVLCFAEANRDKGDRTPREWLGGTPQYDEMIQRVQRMRESGMPEGKIRKFSQAQINLNEFINRQLNDTAYIAREVRRFLQCLYPGSRAQRDQRVRCGRGQITADLRHFWGLNTILDPQGRDEKNRADHRHHAIDAIVIALTTPTILQRLARTRGPQPQSLPDPWAGFRADVERAIRTINVSHRPRRKVSGPLHEETNYGPTNRPDVFVYRKPIEQLTGPMVKRIRDPVIREIVRQRLRERGFDNPATRKTPFPRDTWEPSLQMPSGVPIRRVRVLEPCRNPNSVRLLDNPDGHRAYRAVKLGNNHHIEIFRYEGGVRHGRFGGRIVPLFEAAQRLRRREPVVQRDHGPGTRFVMSLCNNDTVLVHHDSSDRLYRVQKISQTASGGPDITLRLHTAATIDDDSEKLRITSWRRWGELNIRKVTVDPIGRVLPAND